MIPAGIVGTLAAAAQQQGWVVLLAALASYAFFSVGRYYTAKYSGEHGLKGQLWISCHGLQVTKAYEEEGTVDKIFVFGVKNNATFPIALRLKSKIHHDGRIVEDSDFDHVTYLPAKSERHVSSPLMKKVSKGENSFVATLDAIYGKTETNLDASLSISFKEAGTHGYDIIKMNHNTFSQQ